MPDVLTAASSAFAEPLPVVSGLRVEERAPGLATLMVRPGRAGELAERVRDIFGLALPDGPRCARHAGLAFIGTGPGTWLVARDDNPLSLAGDLARAVGDLASVSDQSSGYTVLHLVGPRARSVLQAGLPIDLDPGAFGSKNAAVSLLAHIGVTLWQDDAGSFEIAFFRSMSDSFAQWLRAQIAHAPEKL